MSWHGVCSPAYGTPPVPAALLDSSSCFEHIVLRVPRAPALTASLSHVLRDAGVSADTVRVVVQGVEAGDALLGADAAELCTMLRSPDGFTYVACRTDSTTA